MNFRGLVPVIGFKMWTDALYADQELWESLIEVFGPIRLSWSGSLQMSLPEEQYSWPAEEAEAEPNRLPVASLEVLQPASVESCRPGHWLTSSEQSFNRAVDSRLRRKIPYLEVFHRVQRGCSADNIKGMAPGLVRKVCREAKRELQARRPWLAYVKAGRPFGTVLLGSVVSNSFLVHQLSVMGVRYLVDLLSLPMVQLSPEQADSLVQPLQRFGLTL